MFHLAGTIAGRARVWPLAPGRHTLGRGTENAIALLEPSVSRAHAAIEIDDAGARIRDLGSSNGTRVNDRPVSGTAPLVPGDRVRVGGLTLVFGAGAAPSAPAPFATRVDFSGASEVSAGGRVGLEEARRDLDSGSGATHALLRAVTDAGQLLIAPLPLAETCDRVLALVERVVPARRIFLLRIDSAEGEPEVLGARPPLEAASARLTLSRTILGTVLGERQALLLNDVAGDPRFGGQESVIRQNLRSAMVAPVLDEGCAIGLLYADSDDPRHAYGREQLSAFILMADLVGLKFTQTRLLEAQREKERMEEAVAAAADVQRRMLPAGLPEIDGYRLAARQAPCEGVAGDLYDAARLEDGRLFVVLGDVCGKGLSASLLMANTIAGLRMLYPAGIELARMAERVHQELLQASDATRFVTLFLGLLDPRAHRLEYVNAGHNAPLLFTEAREPCALDATGLPLGMIPGARYASGSCELPPGALLCVYSDGVTEGAREDEMFGDARLIESVRARRAQPLDEIADGLLADLAAFLEGRPAGDDVTLLLLRREG